INTNDLTNQYTNNFVEIPFEMGYLLNDKSRMKIYGTFGLANSFFVSNSYKSSSTLFQANPNDKYNSYSLGAKVGFGVQFNLGKVGIFIEPQTRVYLTKVQTGMTNPVQFSLDVQVLKL
ncbi:MAG: outer membrane beta-barrel protein, partial [Flammeovirgaceae bacterium]